MPRACVQNALEIVERGGDREPEIMLRFGADAGERLLVSCGELIHRLLELRAAAKALHTSLGKSRAFLALAGISDPRLLLLFGVDLVALFAAGWWTAHAGAWFAGIAVVWSAMMMTLASLRLNRWEE